MKQHLKQCHISFISTSVNNQNQNTQPNRSIKVENESFLNESVLTSHISQTTNDALVNTTFNPSRGTSYRSSSRNRNRQKGTLRNNSKRKPNPLDENGDINRCVICDSIYHWANKCPDSYENRNKK